MNCLLELIDDAYVCRYCGRRLPASAKLPIRVTCPKAPAPTETAPADRCLHRGPVVREIGCPDCRGREIKLPVYACALHGECTSRDWSHKSEEFAPLNACERCADRKPAEPEMPSAAARAFHFAADYARDRAAGRPRRSPETIQRIFETFCRRCPQYNSAAGACAVCGCPVSPTEPELNRIAWAELGCSADPPRWTRDATWSPPEIFVLGHEPERLASVADLSHLRKVFLPRIEPTTPLNTPKTQFAENAIFLCDALAESRAEYIGVAASSWNTKYGGGIWKGIRTPRVLPLERLDELPLNPRVVWAAHVNPDPLLISGLDRFLPGLRELVFEALADLWPSPGAACQLARADDVPRSGLLANNFLAHRAVVLDLREWMRRAIAYLDGKYGPAWPLRLGWQDDSVTCRLPAYVAEALSICFFALRDDLTILQIPPP